MHGISRLRDLIYLTNLSMLNIERKTYFKVFHTQILKSSKLKSCKLLQFLLRNALHVAIRLVKNFWCGIKMLIYIHLMQRILFSNGLLILSSSELLNFFEFPDCIEAAISPIVGPTISAISAQCWMKILNKVKADPI